MKKSRPFNPSQVGSQCRPEDLGATQPSQLFQFAQNFKVAGREADSCSFRFGQCGNVTASSLPAGKLVAPVLPSGIAMQLLHKI